MAREAGLTAVAGGRVPFAGAAGVIADVLPAWAQAGPEWTVVTAADGGPCAAPFPARRWIWQGRPRLLWLPAAVAPSPHLHADTVWRDGGPTPLPAPPPEVPRHLLRRLKTLFDPDTTLPCPAWLAARGDQP